MLKYFQKQKNRHVDGFSGNCNDVDTTVDLPQQPQSLPSSSSSSGNVRLPTKQYSTSRVYNDEMFLEELLAESPGYSVTWPPPLEATGSNNVPPHSGRLQDSFVEADKNLFTCHSRLSMNLFSIVSEPMCLSYFVQYLETRNALPYIKFYLDTENFRNAALAQMRKEKQENSEQLSKNDSRRKISKDISIGGEEYVGEEAETNKNVPELRILCDLSMHKPITDDEKSEIYAATSQELTKCYKKNQSLNCREEEDRGRVVPVEEEEQEQDQEQEQNNKINCDENSNNNITNNNSNINRISMASINDALIIYQKYLNKTSTLHLNIPLDIISKISLILCQRKEEEAVEKEEERETNVQQQTDEKLNDDDDDDDDDDECLPITADCFLEAQDFVLRKLEQEYLCDFLQSPYYSKYCVELMECGNLHINDILHSEVTLFYFMEYLEQHDERDCLDFWSVAFNYRNGYLNGCSQAEMREDALIIYEKFFSLKAKGGGGGDGGGLWVSSKLKAHVESIISSESDVNHCFDLPLKVVAIYLERKYLQQFLQSSLFVNYVNELKFRIQSEEIPEQSAKSGNQKNSNRKESLWKGTLLSRSSSDRRATKKYQHHRKLENGGGMMSTSSSISKQNTLLASMDRHRVADTATSTTRSFSELLSSPKALSIDSSELLCSDLLWQRSPRTSSVSEPLKFGHINALGRFERDFLTPSDALCAVGQRSSSSSLQQPWSSFVTDGGNRFKRALRKLVNLQEDKVQEEIAWQVAEMIVKDVTSVTMRQDPHHPHSHPHGGHDKSIALR